MLSRTATVKMMKENNMTDKKLEDLKQSELAELTEKYLKSDYCNPSDKKKKYSVVDNYVKELGNQGVSLKDLRILGEADYTDMDKILGNEENKKLVEKYISEFLRADIITQQPHRTKGTELVQISKKENYVDGGIYLWRIKEDEAFPDEDFDAAPEGESDGGKDEDSNYVRMGYLDPVKFLKKTTILEQEPYNITEEEEIQEFIREKGLKELLQDNGEGRASEEIDVDPSIAKELIYYFTQDPDTDEIIMIKYKKQETITGSFDEPLENIANTVKNGTKVKQEYQIQIVTLPYKDKIAKYIMPYEFLINLCQITQNPEFVYHVALMARDTYIVLKVQDKETIDRDTTDTHTQYLDENGNITSETKLRNIELEKEFEPRIELRYANTWSWLEDFEYKKTYNITNLTITGPTTSSGSNYIKTVWKEEKDGYVTYGEPITLNSIHKSQQFLGLLRNEKGKCSEKDCYKESEWKDKTNPKALECVRKAKFDDEGINVQYYIPGTNTKEPAKNMLGSGLQMLYAVMQSNYSGYKEWENILEDIKEIYNKAKEYLEKGDKDLIDDKYDEGQQDYRNAYIVKMQGTLEHLRYLLKDPPPENEGDLVIQNPQPGSVYNGLGSNVVCYLVGGGVNATGGSEYGIGSTIGGSGDALWNNQISREEFISIVENYNPPSGSGEVTSYQNGYDTWFRPYAAAFFDISVEYGFNPMYIFANGIQESGYGSSSITQQKGNTFGIGAYNDSPGASAHSYGSQEAGIEACVKLLKSYMTPGTDHYNAITSAGFDPTTMEGQMYRYTVPDWQRKG